MRTARHHGLGGIRLAALMFLASGLIAQAAAAQTVFDMRAEGPAPMGAAVQPAFEADGIGAGETRTPAFQMPDGTGQPADAMVAPATAAPTGAPFNMQSTGAAKGPAGAPAARSPEVAAPFQMVPGQPAPVPARPPRTEAAAPRTPDRFIVPIQRLRLEGEAESYGWVTYFTQQEAERPATLLIGYSTSIYVMPELSRLRVTINGQFVADLRIASQGTTQVAQAIPPACCTPGAISSASRCMRCIAPTARSIRPMISGPISTTA